MKTTTYDDYVLRIGKAVAWLEVHADQPIEPKDLAKVASFSPHHFHRVFRGITGESVMQAVRRLRLEKAARRLRHGSEPITDIALQAGFQSHEGFIRAFRRHFDVTPSRFRATRSGRMTVLVEKGELQIPEVEIRRSPSIRMVGHRHQGSFDEIGEVWERFIGMAFGCGLFTGTEQMIGWYPDDPDITPTGKVRYEVGIETGRDAPEPLRAREIPAGRWAVTVHIGSYQRLSDTYLALIGGWFPRSGLELGDHACIERYLNSRVPEAELRTEVWAPIRNA